MNHQHVFNKHILRSYDIRGIVNQNLNEKDSFMLGYFFGLLTKKKLDKNKFPKIIVSRDGRLSSKSLEKNLISGLLKSGSEVVSIGMNPTPILYFADRYLSSDAAIQITGSHNPKNYNGFKMIMFNKSFFGDQITELASFAKKGSNEAYTGSLKKFKIEDKYITEILKPLHGLKQDNFLTKKIIWDCGNGATGKIVKNLVKKIPGKHYVLFSKVDGNFPNHHPDPTRIENLNELKNKILKLNADFGIAFDGDGDRIGIVDNMGNLVPGDLLTAFLSLSINDKNSSVILDVKSSLVAKNKIEQMGFNVDIWKTGHSNIKSRMLMTKCFLAGEMSGHIFFADKYFGYDDAIYASLRFIKLIFNNFDINKFISNLEKSFPTPEIKITCPDEIKFEIVKKITLKLKNKYNEKQLLLIDGVRVSFDFGWFLIRASNTENAIVLRAEGSTNDYKLQLINEAKELVTLAKN